MIEEISYILKIDGKDYVNKINGFGDKKLNNMQIEEVVRVIFKNLLLTLQTIMNNRNEKT